MRHRTLPTCYTAPGKTTSGFWIGLQIPIFILMLGCSACVRQAETPDSTVVALKNAFAQTLTVEAAGMEQPAVDVETLKKNATSTVKSVRATQTAEGTANSISIQTTLQAAEPVIAELPIYGVDPEKGRVGWLHPPLTLEVDGFHEIKYANEFSMVIVRDFVIVADITWDTLYGTSGCGFMLRADGDSEAPSAYSIAASRGGTGYVYFLAQIKGEPANYGSIFAKGNDPNFNWQKGGTNRLAVVGRGKGLSVYSNYTLIGTFDVTAEPDQPHFPNPPPPPEPPDLSPNDREYEDLMARYREEERKWQIEYDDYQRTKEDIQDGFDRVQGNYDSALLVEGGFTGMVAFTESGLVNCQFDNAWMWQIEE